MKGTFSQLLCLPMWLVVKDGQEGKQEVKQGQEEESKTENGFF